MNSTLTADSMLAAGRSERETKRAAMLARCGFDGLIPESVAETILEEIEQVCYVSSIEFTGFRLVINCMTRNDRTTRNRYDLEYNLGRKYGNSPYNLATIFGNYSIAFVAN